MLAGARQVLTTLRDTEDSVARVRQLKTGRLTIGAVSTAKYFLPRLLARFRDEHPGVEIQLSVSNRAELIRLMAGRDVDLAVMGRPPRELETQSELFSPHPLGVIAAPAHPLAQRRRINPGELEDQPFLVRERGSGTRLSMEHFFREHRIAPRTSMEVDSNETIKQAVIANLGLALLSLHTVELELRARLLVVLDVVGTPLMRSWHLVSLRAAGLSPAADAFRQFVLDRGRRLLDEQFKDLPLVTPGDAQPARKSRRSRRKRAR